MPIKSEIAAIIDHTLLSPTTLLPEIEAHCNEAIKFGFASVLVPPIFIKPASAILKTSKVKTGTVIGFPFGYQAIEAKMAEILLAIVDGADELELVINYTAIKNNDWQYAANEISHLMSVIKNAGKIAKVVIESASLNKQEIIKCCELYMAAGADIINTSTGFAKEAVSRDELIFVRSQLPSTVGLKTFQPNVSLEELEGFMAIGINRVGCNNAAVLFDKMNKSAEILA